MTRGIILSRLANMARSRAVRQPQRAMLSDSITYSGGQASEGQGGFYGSGGARAIPNDQILEDRKTNDRNTMLALAQDVQKVRSVMQELEKLESLLDREEGVSAKTIELKNSIKKTMTAPDVIECLNNLEIKGEPVWGLSSEERELIMLAREKVNEC